MQNHAHFAKCMHVWPFEFTASHRYTGRCAGVDLRTRSACQHQRLKSMSQTGGSRPRLAAARCLSLGSHWRGRRPVRPALLGSTKAQSKKEFNADFFFQTNRLRPPPQTNIVRLKKNVDNWRRPLNFFVATILKSS